MSEHLTVPQLLKSTQRTQEWLRAIASRRPFENQEQAYSYLRAVLHTVRDRADAFFSRVEESLGGTVGDRGALPRARSVRP